jgi:hypothetical protein
MTNDDDQQSVFCLTMKPAVREEKGWPQKKVFFYRVGNMKSLFCYTYIQILGFIFDTVEPQQIY